MPVAEIDTVLEVIGVVIAAVGLVGAPLAALLTQPRLGLLFEYPGGGRAITTMYWNPENPAIKTSRIRLTVVNTGRRSARGVVVKIVRAEIQGEEAESPTEVPLLTDRPLAWEETDLRDPNAEVVPAEIAGKGRKKLDLLHINEVAPDELWIDVRPRPVGDSHHLRAHRVTLQLAVEASNPSTREWQMSVTLERPWTHTDECADLRIDGPREA
jgi:hypothetical protein